MRRLLSGSGILLLFAAALLQTQGASAHHSFAAVFDLSRTVNVTGMISMVSWVNPHAHFLVDVQDEDGNVTTWDFELHSPNEMMRRGWPRGTLKPGDVVTVEGSPARRRENEAFATWILFPDGRKLMTGTEGTSAEAPPAKAE